MKAINAWRIMKLSLQIKVKKMKLIIHLTQPISIKTHKIELLIWFLMRFNVGTSPILCQSAWNQPLVEESGDFVLGKACYCNCSISDELNL